MDTATPVSATEQLGDIITTLANSWVQALPRVQGTYEPEINRLLSLSLRTVYELAAKGILKELPVGSTAHITKDRLLAMILPPEPPAPPKPAYVPPPPPPLKDEANGKTFIEGWLHQRRGHTKMDYRMHEVLRFVKNTQPYLEDVTQEAMLAYSRSRLLWDFFVKQRGY
jgi:hypothetical protein